MILVRNGPAWQISGVTEGDRLSLELLIRQHTERLTHRIALAEAGLAKASRLRPAPFSAAEIGRWKQQLEDFRQYLKDLTPAG
jgi:hypothetical protein